MPAPVIRTCLLALAVAPVMMLLASVLGVASGDLSASGWRGGLQILAMAAFALGLFGAAVVIAAQAPRLGVTLLLLGAFGTAGGAGFGADFIHAGAYGARVPVRGWPLDDGAILLGVSGTLFPLAVILLAFGLWRIGLVPPALAGLVAVSGAVFPLGRVPDAPAPIIAADLLLVVGLGLVAVRLLSDHRRGASAPPKPA